MNKIFYLSTCDTCRKIIKEIKHSDKFEMQDIKQKHINATELEAAKKIFGSYESLLNRRAQKLKEIKPDFSKFSEEKYKELILSDYTFLKRPLIIIGKQIFAGNSPTLVKEINSLI